MEKRNTSPKSGAANNAGSNAPSPVVRSTTFGVSVHWFTLRRITEAGLRHLTRDRHFDIEIDTRYKALDKYQDETWKSDISMSQLEPNNDDIWPLMVPKSRMHWFDYESAIMNKIDEVKIAQRQQRTVAAEEFSNVLCRTLS